MDPRINPYSPGAGTIPQTLAGRDDLIEKIDIELNRCRNGYSYRGQILVGLRGVGKTVLLNKISNHAEFKGYWSVFIETPENRSLPSILISPLRNMLISSDFTSQTKHLAKQTLGLLGGFAKAMKLKFNDIEFSLDIGNKEGADTGDLKNDLTKLLIAIGTLAKKQGTALVLFIDEIQYIKEEQFASLIVALHRCTQKQLPVSLIGAGLPQVVGQAGRAKSYAERFFEYPKVGALDRKAAIQAIVEPAEKRRVKFEKKALNEILRKTECYPYFIQEWGKHCWKVAQKSPITFVNVKKATELALVELDNSFFRVRLDRCTPLEKTYLRAMAELGPGSQKSGDIANVMGKSSQQVAPIRAHLISKGMIYSPAHGDNNFTVPLFDEFMKRVIPDFQSNLE